MRVRARFFFFPLSPFPSFSSSSCRKSLPWSLRKGVFERHMSTGSEAFSPFICLDANKFVLLSLFSLIKTIYPLRVSTKALPNVAKSPLPVDVRRSKTLWLKLPIVPLSCSKIVILRNRTGEERRRQTLCDKRDNNFV